VLLLCSTIDPEAISLAANSASLISVALPALLVGPIVPSGIEVPPFGERRIAV